MLRVGKKMKAIGKPGGIANSHCNDSNHTLRSIMWSFGASEVASDGKTLKVDSPEMRDQSIPVNQTIPAHTIRNARRDDLLRTPAPDA